MALLEEAPRQSLDVMHHAHSGEFLLVRCRVLGRGVLTLKVLSRFERRCEEDVRGLDDDDQDTTSKFSPLGCCAISHVRVHGRLRHTNVYSIGLSFIGTILQINTLVSSGRLSPQAYLGR